MALMPTMTAELIRDNVCKRLQRGVIYTNVSDILISVNPYTVIPGLYDDHQFEAFHYQANSSAVSSLQPHIFALGRRVFRGAVGYGVERQAQSVIVSGESGAGKTEATKMLLRYIAQMCANVAAAYAGFSSEGASEIRHRKSIQQAATRDVESDSLEEKIMSTNPVLEAFGNAKTHRNDNSSRFGKWISLEVSSHPIIVGAKISKYLLEESRITSQATGERNFNIFYQVCAGASGGGYDPKNFFYLNQSGCTTIDGVNDAEAFAEVVEALRCLGFSAPERLVIFNIIKGILHLGNTEFVMQKGSTDLIEVSGHTRIHIKTAAELLGIHKEDLEQCLCSQVMLSARGTLIKKKRDLGVAASTRDSISKFLYDQLFEYLVFRINQSISSTSDKLPFPTAPSSMAPPPPPPPRLNADQKESIPSERGNGERRISRDDGKDTSVTTIGILDIFGFENFDINSLEQLCINYANEKLQNFFFNFLVVQQLSMYATEGIHVPDMNLEGNAECLKLLEGAGGIFSLLADELSVPKGTDETILRKYHQQHEKHPNFVRPKMGGQPEFTVIHYAQPVTYQIAGFLEKNKQKVTEDIFSVFSASKSPLVASFFKKTAMKGKKTGGEEFRRSLGSLLESIRATCPHFIRCIKPNNEKLPGVVDKPVILNQLVTSGIIDAVKVRQHGFALHMLHAHFLKEFAVCVTSSLAPTASEQKAQFAALALPAQAEWLLRFAGLSDNEWQVGATRVFLKQTAYDQLEHVRLRLLATAAIRIQRRARGLVARRRLKARKTILASLQACLKLKKWSELDTLLKQAQTVGVLPRLRHDILAQKQVIVSADVALSKLLDTLQASYTSLTERQVAVAIAMQAASELATSLALPGHLFLVDPRPTRPDTHPLVCSLLCCQRMHSENAAYLTALKKLSVDPLSTLEQVRVLSEAAKQAVPFQYRGLDMEATALAVVVSSHEALLEGVELDECYHAVQAARFAWEEAERQKEEAERERLRLEEEVRVRKEEARKEELRKEELKKEEERKVQQEKEKQIAEEKRQADVKKAEEQRVEEQKRLDALQVQEREEEEEQKRKQQQQQQEQEEEKKKRQREQKEIAAAAAAVAAVTKQQQQQKEAEEEEKQKQLQAKLLLLHEQQQKQQQQEQQQRTEEISATSSSSETSFPRESQSCNTSYGSETPRPSAPDSPLSPAETPHSGFGPPSPKMPEEHLKAELLRMSERAARIEKERGIWLKKAAELRAAAQKKEQEAREAWQQRLKKEREEALLAERASVQQARADEKDDAKPVSTETTPFSVDPSLSTATGGDGSAPKRLHAGRPSIRPNRRLHRKYMTMFDKEVLDHHLTYNRRIAYTDGVRIFGGDLESAVAVSPFPVPVIMIDLVGFLTTNGLKEEGLFRVPGQATRIKELQALYDTHQEVQLDEVSNVAALLKLYLRELSSPLVPYNFYNTFLDACLIEDAEAKMTRFRQLLTQELPPNHREALAYLMEFLNLVAEHSEENKMHAHNLALVFAPNLLQTEDSSRMVSDSKVTIECIEYLIVNHASLFPFADTQDVKKTSMQELLADPALEQNLVAKQTMMMKAGKAPRHPGPGVLRVEVHGGSELLESSQPALKIRCAGAEWVSAAAKRGWAPEWKFKIKVRIADPSEEALRITVVDEKTGAPMGELMFLVFDIATVRGNQKDGKLIRRVFRLRSQKANCKGLVDLSLSYLSDSEASKLARLMHKKVKPKEGGTVTREGRMGGGGGTLKEAISDQPRDSAQVEPEQPEIPRPKPKHPVKLKNLSRTGSTSFLLGKK